MVEINSTSRFFSINTKVILTQTDTTVGFLSQDADKLQTIKSRSNSKPFIKVYKNFQALKKAGQRVPNRLKKELRRASKTTYIVKDKAFRVVQDRLHSQLLHKTTWNYSTSANETAKNFDREFCTQKADIIIEDKNSLHEGKSSKLYKINSLKKVRLR